MSDQNAPEIIANFYAEKYDQALAQLAEYQALENAGKLIRLPCAIGDKIYTIHEDVSPCAWCADHGQIDDVQACYARHVGDERGPNFDDCPQGYTILALTCEGFEVKLDSDGQPSAGLGGRLGHLPYHKIHEYEGIDGKQYYSREAAETAMDSLSKAVAYIEVWGAGQDEDGNPN